MALVYLLEKFGISIPNRMLVWLFFIFITILFVFGLLWYKLGLYETEVWVNWAKNPVGKESLTLLREIRAKLK